MRIGIIGVGYIGRSVAGAAVKQSVPIAPLEGKIVLDASTVTHSATVTSPNWMKRP